MAARSKGSGQKRTFAPMQGLFLSLIVEDSALGAPLLTLPPN
jgi:hypothetical protein